MLDPVLRRVREASDELLARVRQSDHDFYSSLVIEYVVPKDKAWAFRQWYGKLVRAAKKAEGFVRADRYRPLNCGNQTVKWYSVLHFDSPEALDRWLTSEQREELMQTGQEFFEAYKFKSFTTGLEGWFSRQSRSELSSLGPPAWKQILTVVLGLYPIIMVQGFVFESLGIMESWSPADAMLINNVITTCILTLVVMPLVVRFLDFWLQPAHRRAPLRSEVVGTLIVVMAMSLMVFIFDELPLG